ncbi:hypothetical protein ACFS7Z_20065 [Pontibacter toksunensis]|uniref:Uncharacterized protein n=1 Tax=Pontibacter toksunensis TaxID=1332631 RepID=A0ABW6C0G2_9BACT
MAGANVYENFSNDIYNALEQAREELSKYHTLNLIFPSDSYFPCDIVTGFVNFCQKYAFAYSIINNISEEQIREGEVYINLIEDDLVLLLDNIIIGIIIHDKDLLFWFVDRNKRPASVLFNLGGYL